MPTTTTKSKRPRPILPSAALREQYAGKIERELEAMHRSLVYWVRAQWRADSPALAMDASPARELRKTLRRKGRLWRTKFRQLAPKLGAYFAELARMLRDHGFTVRFRMSRAMNDVVQATVAENVTLISNVAEEHLARIEGIVMRGVQQGRDLAYITNELEEGLGIARRRAQGIARNQVNSANATMVRTRQLDLGITQAKWLHSAGGKTPRPEHVHMSGKLYDVKKGLLGR
jgi:uncharacterized protein with gpF-like domain